LSAHQRALTARKTIALILPGERKVTRFILTSRPVIILSRALRRPWPHALLSVLLLLPCHAGSAQPRTLDFADVLALALRTDGAGAQVARLAEERAASVVLGAEGAYQWSLASGFGARYAAEIVALNGFLTTQTRDRWPLVATASGERLLENGMRVRVGMAAIADVSDETRRRLYPLANRPTFSVDIPLNGSLGTPAEGFRLEAARNEHVAATRDSALAKDSFIYQVGAGFWRAVYAEQRRQVQSELREVIAEVAQHFATRAAQGAISPAEAEQWQARLELRRIGVERAAQEAATRRDQLNAILQVESEASHRDVRYIAPFPEVAAASRLAKLDLDALVSMALERRPEVEVQRAKVKSARLKARAADRETASRFSLVTGFDRVMVEYSRPLGAMLNVAAQRQHQAEIDIAEVQLKELERTIRVQLRESLARLTGAEALVRGLSSVVARLAQSLANTREQVRAGMQPAAAVASGAESLAQGRDELLEARLRYTLALLELRSQTAAVAAHTGSGRELAALLVTLPN